MSSISSKAFEALGRVTWKLARRKVKDTVQDHTPGSAENPPEGRNQRDPRST